MAIRVLMPKLSFIVTEGTIIEWLKAPGDQVDKGEPLLSIESEKATVDVESPGAGILGPDLAPVGTTVPVTTTIGYILEPGEEPPKLELGLDEADHAPAAGPGQPVEEVVAAAREEEKPPKRRIIASPSAKRLAREAGVDLAEIEGSGPQGRIVKQDVLAYVDSQSQVVEGKSVQVSPAARRLATSLGVDPGEVEGTGPGGRVMVDDVRQAAGQAHAQGDLAQTPERAAGPPSEHVALTSIQRISAERMAFSFQTAPHFYLSVQVNMSQAVAMREAFLPAVEAKTGVRLSFSDILVCAVGQALHEHPTLNAAFEEDQLKRYREVNVCLAVDTPRGLTVPVFHQADQLSLAEIAGRRADIVEKAKNSQLTPDDLSGGTFTVSNLGMFGIDIFSAIINPPQAAILAVGRIAKRALVVDETLQVRPTMWMTLSVDHRVADGATAARFLHTLVQYLEDPYRMLV